MTDEVPTGLDVVLYRDVYEHCFSALSHEVCGVLVGTPDGERPASIVGAIPALQATESAASVTFTQDAWSSIYRRLDADFHDCEIRGWYHTHPGYGVFLSEQDMFIHRNFFNRPSLIAVVIDPVAQREAIFGWQGNEVVEVLERATSYRGRRVDSPSQRRRAAPPTVSTGSTQGVAASSTPRHDRMPASRLSLATWIYIAIIAASLGVCLWELVLR
jgi:proteasome lid subunit RPN8/RPN11